MRKRKKIEEERQENRELEKTNMSIYWNTELVIELLLDIRDLLHNK